MEPKHGLLPPRQSADMRVLRLIKGVTRRDRCNNKDIRGEVGVDSILEELNAVD